VIPLHIIRGRSWFLWWHDDDRYIRRGIHWAAIEVKEHPYIEARGRKKIWGPLRRVSLTVA